MATQARHWRDFRAVWRPVGAVMIGIAIAIGLCGATGTAWDYVAPSSTIPVGGGWACLVSALICAGAGAPLTLYGRRHNKTTLNHSKPTLSRREAILAVALIWLVAGVCGGLPFVIGAGLDPAGAFFESVSGLTTTGATVIGDIETRLSRPLLLWRSMTQWLGGMGIVVLFVAVMPSLGAGGKHLYKGEAPGAQAEGFRPRIAETSLALWKFYAFFTALEILLLSLLGMDVFEALCHGLTTMSTGGFSTRDASVGAFAKPAFEWVIGSFMLVGSVNYGLYYLALRGRKLSAIYRNVEFRTYVAIVVVSVVLLTLLNLNLHPQALDSLRYAFFMVATTVSSTGYATDDYTAFGPVAYTVMLSLMFIGGCSGSTAGGIKIERVVIMAKQAMAQVRRNFDPTVVRVVRMGRHIIAKPVIADVVSFFVIYMLSIGVGIAAVAALDGVPVPTAFGAMLTCLSNMGPSPFHNLAPGFADNFAGYSAAAKCFFALAMLLGRLEFFTLLALLVPGFWRR